MQSEFPFDLPQPLRSVRDRLLDAYGPQRDVRRHDPIAQFVKAIISPRTLDAESDAAFMRLRTYLLSWDVLPDASPVAIAVIIRNVKFAPDKAARLVKAAQIVRAHAGRFDLAFLADWPVEDALTWLRRLPGINSKVAATILNFSSLRKRALAVDTHVLRVSKRLGLVRNNADFEAGFRMLMRLIPDDWDADDLYEFHWLVKVHGQTRCRHYQRFCAGCPLAKLCAASSEATAAGTI